MTQNYDMEKKLDSILSPLLPALEVAKIIPQIKAIYTEGLAFIKVADMTVEEIIRLRAWFESSGHNYKNFFDHAFAEGRASVHAEMAKFWESACGISNPGNENIVLPKRPEGMSDSEWKEAVKKHIETQVVGTQIETKTEIEQKS